MGCRQVHPLFSSLREKPILHPPCSAFLFDFCNFSFPFLFSIISSEYLLVLVVILYWLSYIIVIIPPADPFFLSFSHLFHPTPIANTHHSIPLSILSLLLSLFSLSRSVCGSYLFGFDALFVWFSSSRS